MIHGDKISYSFFNWPILKLFPINEKHDYY